MRGSAAVRRDTRRVRFTIVGCLAPVLFGVTAACSLLVDTGGLADDPAGVQPGSGGDGGGPSGDSDGSPSLDAREASAGSAYRDVVMADGPLAYYRLDEKTRGVAKDETGRFDGVHSASVEVGAPPLLGGSEAAAKFGGTDNISVDGLDFQGNAPFTVELWLSKSAVQSDHRFPFFKETGTESTRRGYAIVVIDDHVAGERYVTGTGFDVSASGIGAGRVVHIVMTYDGTSLALYVDGALADTKSDSRALEAPVRLR